MTAWQPPLGY